MKSGFLPVIPLVLIIVISGCTESIIPGGNVIETQEPVTEEGVRDVLVIKDIETIPNPPLIPGSQLILSFVIENKDTEKSITDIVIDLFDAPTFYEETGATLCNDNSKPCTPEDDQCASTSCTLLPGEEKMINFVLRAPTKEDIANLETDIELNFRVSYHFETSLLYRTMLINMDEIETMQRQGESISLEIPKFLGSGPVQLDVELKGAPYIIAGYSGTLVFTVKKVGSSDGILKGSEVPADGIAINFPSGVGTVEADKFSGCPTCTNSEPITLYRGVSPSLYFKINDIQEISVPYQSFDIDATMGYDYELRDSIKVKVKPYD